jgi:hypothetical protein
MSLQDMINSFQNVLNRDDCSAAQAQAFVLQGVSRIQRECRLPSMERLLTITPTGNVSSFAVPSDMIQVIDVIAPDRQGQMRALEKVPYRRLIHMDNVDDVHAYARFQNQFYIAGTLLAPDPTQNWAPTIQVLYYGQFTPFTSLSSENEVSSAFPELGVYAGLVYAGDAFQHPSKADWETTYQQIKADVIGMAVDLEMEGGPSRVQEVYEPSYGWNE